MSSPVEEPDEFRAEPFDLWHICASPREVMEPNMRSMREPVLVLCSTAGITTSSSPQTSERR